VLLLIDDGNDSTINYTPYKVSESAGGRWMVMEIRMRLLVHSNTSTTVSPK